MILVLGKNRSRRAPNLGYRGAESPWQFDVSPKSAAQDLLHEQAHCCDEAANHQLAIAAAYWIIQIVSAEECSSLMQNLMQIHCSTLSVILNSISRQYTCLLNGIYCSHWLLLQWSCHCSHINIPVHSPSLPGYFNVMQTVPVILTMAGLFPGRPCLYIKWIRRQNISQLKEIFRVKGSALQIRWIGKAYMNQIILNLCKLNAIYSFIYLSIAHI